MTPLISMIFNNPFDNILFGIMTTLLSSVKMSVVNICTSITTPFLPCVSTMSLTLKGLKSKMRTPPAKLASVPCNARPTAKPAAPNKAMTEVVRNPAKFKIEIISTVLRVKLSRFRVNF